MVGIKSFGAYIPWNRLSRKTISSAMGFFNPATLPGEKAVANYDEDSVTLAVAAGMDCLSGADKSSIDAVYLASTTLPFKERLNCGIVSTALDLRSDIRSADFTATLRSGTTALLAALDAVKAKTAKEALVCASDIRMGKMGSSLEQLSGDGAAAYLLGEEDVAAAFEGSYSLSLDFIDHWKAETESYVSAWEERWIREEGYLKFFPMVIDGLLKKYNLKIEDFSKVIMACPHGKVVSSMAKKMGINDGQLQDNMAATVGDTGSAYPLMLLVSALQDAKPGDNILLVGYGNGADALCFKVTDKILRTKNISGIKGYLYNKTQLDSYQKYAVFRDMLPLDLGARGDVFPTQLSHLWRQSRVVTGLYGTKCLKCGTVQYPAQRICVNPDCGAIDQMEPHRFAEKTGKLFNYTGDNLTYCPNPPAAYGLVDFDGGGRYHFDLTDCTLESLKVGLPVRMSFRRKYIDKKQGISGYFWKAVPIRES